VGDEPTDVAFAQNRAFVAVSQEDVVKVYSLANLNAAPVVVPLFSRDVRALAVANDGTKVYAVTLRSGNQTTIVTTGAAFPAEGLDFDPARLGAMNLRDMSCTSPPPPYPGLPAGIERNPELTDPADGVPKVSLIVRWDNASGKWVDEAGQDWSACLPYRLPDHDLFVIDAATLAVSHVDHLGTSLFEVAVHPGTGRIYVPHTEARNFVRFEHALGVRGHMVDNRLAVVDPGSGHSVTLVDLNTHIDRDSDPAANLAERQASISQPGMLVWSSGGAAGYLTAIGSRKLFRLDGSCLAGSCIFGPNRAAPAAVEVGEGPTGVALHEGRDRLYVLNRISHSLALVQASSMTLLEELPLHDPSSPATRNGRRFLYDGIDSSGHGDAACSSCHLSGDMDGLAWDLGDPTGELAPYTLPGDNVRFIFLNPFPPHEPISCSPETCAAHEGFDPQKGPMTTQTLRAMLEPLHWRGDRATMNEFNPAFVGLMGRAEGLTAQQMEQFRQFALETRFPPNPFRKVDDTTPCGRRSVDPLCEVRPNGMFLGGNPTEGAALFDTHLSDGNAPCRTCHTHPFGAAGGKLDGVAPLPTTSPDAAALFNGDLDGSPHSDLKVPHLRNMYEKFGPVWAPPAGQPPETRTGFGFVHDGSIPDLFRFLSASVFNLSAANQAQQVRDISSFMFHFPTGTRPAVGRQVTLPAGTPPTGSPADESLLTTLVSLGDLTHAARHCELVASTLQDGRLRSYHLAGGAWIPDVALEASVTTLALRQGAQGPITFTCATAGSGPRLGGDRDEDLAPNGDDCAPDDGESWSAPLTVTNLRLSRPGPRLLWDDQSGVTGPGLRYDVLGGDLSALRASGFAGTTCLASELDVSIYVDGDPDPPAGDGTYYLVRSRNACGTGYLGPGRESIQELACP
jgi:DNA-binding beta-propeller fold protein YncE